MSKSKHMLECAVVGSSYKNEKDIVVVMNCCLTFNNISEQTKSMLL